MYTGTEVITNTKSVQTRGFSLILILSLHLSLFLEYLPRELKWLLSILQIFFVFFGIPILKTVV